jgi:hypothetical protein
LWLRLSAAHPPLPALTMSILPEYPATLIALAVIPVISEAIFTVM